MLCFVQETAAVQVSLDWRVYGEEVRHQKIGKVGRDQVMKDAKSQRENFVFDVVSDRELLVIIECLGDGGHLIRSQLHFRKIS